MNYIMDEVQDDTEVHQVSAAIAADSGVAPSTLALEVKVEGASVDAMRPAASGKWQAPKLEEQPICANCKVRHSSHLVPRIEGSPICNPCYESIVYELQAQELRKFSLINGFIWGTAFSVATVVAWAALASSYKSEFAFLAILLGYLAGRGVVFGVGRSRGQALQVVASICALIGVIIHKYLSFVVNYSTDILAKENASLGVFSKEMLRIALARMHNSITFVDVIFGLLAISIAFIVPHRKYLHFQYPEEQFTSTSSIHPAALKKSRTSKS